MGNLNSSLVDLPFPNGFCYLQSESTETHVFVSLKEKVLHFSLGEGNLPFKSIKLDKDFKIVREIQEKQSVVISFISGKTRQSSVMRTETVEQFLLWSSYFKSLKRPGWDSSDSQFCKVCAKEFNFFRRQHHCRKCGKVVCRNHGNKKIWLRELGYNTKQRVCMACFNI
jgi:hypothetical protein